MCFVMLGLGNLEWGCIGPMHPVPDRQAMLHIIFAV